MAESSLPFASLVTRGLKERGLTLRALCRAAELDPSFFSKVLSGKRSPPSEEEVLRRIAALLGMDPAELIVSAGRIPAEWRALWEDPELLRDIHSRMLEAASAPPRPAAASPKGSRDARPPAWTAPRPRAAQKTRISPKTAPDSPARRILPRREDLAEELL